MLYDGKPVTLTPEQEEIATFYAVMLGTDYLKNPTFNKNFFADWKKVLGPGVCTAQSWVAINVP